MTPLLFLALSLRGQTGDSVPDLVRRLGDDSIEVREEAAAELVRRGEPARAGLEQAREESSDAEVCGRVGDVLARLDRERRRRAFAGGAAVDGLSGGLRVREGRWKHELRLTLEIMNVGKESRTLALVDTWNARLPGTISSADASQAGLVVFQVSGDRPQRLTFRTACGGEPAGAAVSLQPGESRTFERSLSLKELSAGTYTVHVEYYAKKLLGSSGDLRTNSAFFKVAP